jgi:hypothetical protein
MLEKKWKCNFQQVVPVFTQHDMPQSLSNTVWIKKSPHSDKMRASTAQAIVSYSYLLTLKAKQNYTDSPISENTEDFLVGLATFSSQQKVHKKRNNYFCWWGMLYLDNQCLSPTPVVS